MRLIILFFVFIFGSLITAWILNVHRVLMKNIKKVRLSIGDKLTIAFFLVYMLSFGVGLVLGASFSSLIF